jgi:hypothetical protein
MRAPNTPAAVEPDVQLRALRASAKAPFESATQLNDK